MVGEEERKEFEKKKGMSWRRRGRKELDGENGRNGRKRKCK